MHLHISDVLTVITGRLLSRDGMDGVYRILNYMTGDDLYTHQLPRALEVCGPALIAQYPHLANAESQWEGASNPDAIAAWVARFGPEWPDVQPAANWRHRDPISEAVEMMGIDRVIPFRPDDADNTRN